MLPANLSALTNLTRRLPAGLASLGLHAGLPGGLTTPLPAAADAGYTTEHIGHKGIRVTGHGLAGCIHTTHTCIHNLTHSTQAGIYHILSGEETMMDRRIHDTAKEATTITVRLHFLFIHYN
jgi:hypothetical protein